MWGVLTPTIELWSFGSPEGLSSPHFGSVSLILTLSQSRVATTKVGTPVILGRHNFVCRPLIEMSSKQSCSLCRELSNGMLHAICTHRNWVGSRLLMVGSQIANLTPNPSFGHNLCFKCWNGQCETILNIYVPRSFHWYKELFKPLNFDPYNCPLKIRESTGTPTPKVELPWGVKVHSLTPSHTPGSMLCDFRLPSWLATLQTLALVASLRLGLRQL